jgi:hypothetical protein
VEVPPAPEPGGAAFYQRVSQALAQLRKRMPQTGTVIVSFGAAPGVSDAQVAITGQKGITAESIVFATLASLATIDHSADEHLVEPLRVFAGGIVPGVGFTVYAIYAGTGEGRPYGQWTAAWSWS